MRYTGLLAIDTLVFFIRIIFFLQIYINVYIIYIYDWNFFHRPSERLVPLDIMEPLEPLRTILSEIHVDIY